MRASSHPGAGELPHDDRRGHRRIERLRPRLHGDDDLPVALCEPLRAQAAPLAADRHGGRRERHAPQILRRLRQRRAVELQPAGLQQLQQQADNLYDLLEIESSLTDVQSQIESWQSQMDWYNDQVEECTVYVSLSEVSTYSPPSEGFGSRIASASADGWQNFVDGVQQLAVTLAGAWPVVVIAAAVAAGVVGWKKKEK